MIEALNALNVGVDPPKTADRTRSAKPEPAPPPTESVQDKVAAEREAKDPVVNREAAAEAFAKAFEGEFPSGASLDIEVNENAGGFVYKAVDPETGEVVKQFPAAEVIERLERLSRFKGLAVDGSV